MSLAVNGLNALIVMEQLRGLHNIICSSRTSRVTNPVGNRVVHKSVILYAVVEPHELRTLWETGLFISL